MAAGVALRDGKVLVCKRSAGRPHAGKWEFPGGKVEAGETVAEALVRELGEELGIRAEVGEELWRTRHRYAPRDAVELHFLAIGAFVGEPGGVPHFDEVRWQALERLGELDFLAADRALVEALVAGRVRALVETSRAKPRVGKGPLAPVSTSARSRGARRDR